MPIPCTGSPVIVTAFVNPTTGSATLRKWDHVFSPTAEHAGSAELLLEVEDQSAKTVAEQSNVEVVRRDGRTFEICEELCRVDR
jgi:hypothetical protein